MRALVALAVASAGCISDPGFRCDDNAGCGAPAVNGVCEPTHYCAFTDVTCTSGWRYGAEASNTLRRTCVPADDGGTADAPFGTPDAPFGGTTDAPFGTPDAPFGTPDVRPRPDARPLPDAQPVADAPIYPDAPLGGVSVTVSPSSKSMLPLTGFQFTATVTGSGNKAVTWSTLDPNGGTISSTGAYVAPGVDGTYHIRATSNADPTRYQTVTIDVTRELQVVQIVRTSGVTAPTGWGNQHHLFETPSGEWWLLYETQGLSDSIGTMWSTNDFMSWMTSWKATLPNTNSADGRDLAGSFQSLPSGDVLHADVAAVDLDRWHFKGVVYPGVISWGGYKRITGAGAVGPDGTALLVKTDGEVMEITGFEPTPATPPLDPCGSGDDDLFTADTLDTGATDFSSTGPVTWTQQVLWCVGYLVHSRQLLADAAGNVYFLFDDADEDPPQNVLLMNRTPDKTWHPVQPGGGPKVRPPRMFGSDLNFDMGGWSGVLFQGQLHVIRRLTDMTTYHHRVFDIGTGTTFDGALVPSGPTTAVTGIFFGHYGDGLILVVSDVNDNIMYCWTDGTTWTQWVTMGTGPITGGNARSYLAGYDPESSGGDTAIIWSQVNNVAGMTIDIMGAILPD
jgi:hypothetical protein